MSRELPPRSFRVSAPRVALLAFVTLLAPLRLPCQEPRAPAPSAREADSSLGDPQPARLTEQSGESDRESSLLDSRVREVERQIARQVARRDALLTRLEREPAQGLAARLIEAWERRRTRAELERLVAELQSGQARLLALRARRRGLADAAAERDWERLQSLVDDAARAWSEGRAAEPTLGPAIAQALDKVGGASPAQAFERYRALLDRLARVNAVLAATAAAAESPEDPPALGVTAGSTGPRTSAEAGASRFLGVAERGLPVSRPTTDASQEAWKRLRTTLADEIVSTATEITLRVRSSS